MQQDTDASQIEYALVRRACDGSIWLVSGGEGGIALEAGDLLELFVHSHVWSEENGVSLAKALEPSSLDWNVMRNLKSMEAYIIAGEDMLRYWIDTEGGLQTEQIPGGVANPPMGILV
jgi:hypothetical protein